MNRRALLIWTILSLFATIVNAREYADTAVYQGLSLKLDLASPVIEAARSGGKIQDYELAVNVRLARRWYPTLELGYAQADCTSGGGHHTGLGGFGRIGLDISALKKGASENCLLVGFRVGTSCQSYQLTNVVQHVDYWQTAPVSFLNQTHWDAWGEVVAGCQVQIAKGFQMGWYVRLKVLFTRTAKDGGPLPYYMPGFGFRNDTNWGLNYYLAWKF